MKNSDNDKQKSSDFQLWTAEEINSDCDEKMKFGSSVNISEELGDESSSSRSATTEGAFSWMRACMTSFLLLLLLAIGLYLARTYVKAVLSWIENQNDYVALSIFVVLFTAVSFPFMWGYIVLNVVCGYLYGFFLGLLVVMAAVLIGTIVAHLVMSKLMYNCVVSKIPRNGVLNTTLRVLGGPHTFKVIAVTRLTPVPFGLQNALFAISPIGFLVYLSASVVGLLPTQTINAYLGSTLRSMEDVLTDDNTATTGYIVFAVQIVISVVLTVYVVHKAKLLFRDVMVESKSESSSQLTEITTDIQ